MEPREVAAILQSISSLYEISGENPFKVVAIRKAAETLAQLPETTLGDVNAVRHLPGIGPTTARIIQDIVQMGPDQALAHLNLPVPASLLELLTLRGIGPKTARLLYDKLGVASLADLERAVQDDKLQTLSGMGRKKVNQVKTSLEEWARTRHVIPIALAWPLVCYLCSMLVRIPGVVRAEPTGEARRLVQECSAVDCVVSTEDPVPLLEWANNQGWTYNAAKQVVSRVLVVGERSCPAHVYIASPQGFAVCWLWTSSDETHQGVLTELARHKGYTLQHNTLIDHKRHPVRCDNESQIYESLGLPYYVPELREGRGILQDPSSLVQHSEIRGDLHVHSRWSDGSLSIRDMALAARDLGYEYIAITDHSQRLKIANGLSREDLLRQKEEIHRLNEEIEGICILHGIEVDILPEGDLDLPDDVLWDLDVVIASIHSHMWQSKPQLTKRLVRAIEHPAVDIIGHLTGRIIGRRSAYPINMTDVLEAAARKGICIEINANPNRLDISDETLRQAASLGAWIAINTDAHDRIEYNHIHYGIRMSYRGWVKKQQVLNTLSLPLLQRQLHRSRAIKP